jgi:hypothetical protein
LVASGHEFEHTFERSLWRAGGASRRAGPAAAQDTDQLTDTVRVEQVQALRRLADRLDGHCLQRLADLDARGAAAADPDCPAPSTASWLRARLRLSPTEATSMVRTARRVFAGPLTGTAQVLLEGTISLAHATVLAHGTHDLTDQVTVEAEPVLVDAARRLDPLRLRRLVGQLRLVTDPEGAGEARERRHADRWLRLTTTLDDMVTVDGLLEPKAGATVLAALEPLARPADATDDRTGGQRHADALAELARRAVEAGGLPQTGGVRPQLTVTVDLESLLGHPAGVTVGGDLGELGWLDPEGCRRLACDSAVTRVVIRRQLSSQPHVLGSTEAPAGLADQLQAAVALLPPTLGGAASQPLDVGRTSRVVASAQRAALVVRDRGGVFPGCQRPPSWCDGHHLWHWLDGGPTDLDNLALRCRAHHRTVHEEGWELTRGPDGRFTTTPPRTRRPPHRRPTPPPEHGEGAAGS